MKSKPIFVKPAGRRIDRENVSWYDVGYRDAIDVYYNTGDIAVHESTLRMLDYEMAGSYVLNIDLQDDAILENSNISHDFICLRGSNYIHENMDWGHFGSWIERLNLPVLCLGVGAQSATRRRMTLPSEGLRIWEMISERCNSIGVRGSFTAEVLNDNGIKNAEIVGCPTLFRSRNPNFKLRSKTYADIATLSFSIRRETDHTYTTDIPAFLAQQKAIIERLARTYDLYLTAHGEIEEKIIFYKDPKRLAEAHAVLRQQNWFDGEDSVMQRLYETRLFFTGIVGHLEQFMSNMDATIGYRVHGVLPALAQGIPAVLLEYDARSSELAQTLDVPLITPQEALELPFAEIFDPARFLRFEQRYPANYARMKRFLDRNDIAHRM
jgi:hypothetical protein